MPNKSQSKKKILIIDNYKLTGTTHIENVRKTVEDAGYEAKIIRYADAKKEVSENKDILEGYHGAVSSGSGKTWEKSKEKDSNGNLYLVNEDIVHKHLARHEKPLYAICAGYHGLANALGYKIKDTGAFNRKHDKENGHQFNHKYGLDSRDIDSKLKNVETFKHNGRDYVKSFDYKNKRGVQYHAERTEQGRKEITNFLKQYIR